MIPATYYHYQTLHEVTDAALTEWGATGWQVVKVIASYNGKLIAPENLHYEILYTVLMERKVVLEFASYTQPPPTTWNG